ncbi:MAG: hypothetical protein NDI60_10390 [Elusimicrobiales bacterium]|nr:hypothetical protein [Elusimicrobiales bacterium]
MKLSAMFFAAAAVVVFCPGVRAAEIVPPKIETVKPAAAVQLAAPATAQLSAPCLESCDFDALSTVNDPLYREGSKEFLKQVAATAPAAAPQAKPALGKDLRDAPNSAPAAAPHPAIKKPAGKKHGPADPVKVKNTL